MKANCLPAARESLRPSRCRRQLIFYCGLLLILVGILLASCSSAESNESIAVVQAAYDRLNEGDVDGFLEYFSDDAILMSDDGEATSPLVARYFILDFIKQEYRVEISDLTADGNVVGFTYDLYFRNTNQATYTDYVDVISDGKIIFDGRDMFRSAYCEQMRNTLAFCK